ncbi:hypothetical protein CSHISOI_03172 [Colletotrichum shisoi]|uniref:Uncharacterized protein n=1 Tax=Colletotrichum shisoi TaxID=2078593 RepID=A0A5Q4BZP8_9PEZI|nr:hypothetical protein CSHISOI_03172 [Colletotrichum shisoi]
MAAALPQDGAIPPSPTGADCSTLPGGRFSGYGIYDSNALRSAGYSILTSLSVFTSCPTSTTTLPPSPTGSLCSPHGDHWHCKPTATPSAAASSTHFTTTSSDKVGCMPHDDHWHCTPGVPQPTTPPGGSLLPTSANQEPSRSTGPAPVETCEAHHDHWHCPPGVEEPPPLSEQRQLQLIVLADSQLLQPVLPQRQSVLHTMTTPGVAEPTTPPAGAGAPSPTHAGDANDGLCVPHDDHWHCPPGVEEPSTPPSSGPASSAIGSGRGSAPRPTPIPTRPAGAGTGGESKSTAPLQASTLASSTRDPTRTSPAIVVTGGAVRFGTPGSPSLPIHLTPSLCTSLKMKYLTLLLAVLSILGLVAAQIPIKPPAYFGAPSTPKKKTLKRRDIGPRTGRPHVVNVANIRKPVHARPRPEEE